MESKICKIKERDTEENQGDLRFLVGDKYVRLSQ